MAATLTLPVVIPLVGAAIALLAWRSIVAQRAVAVLAVVAALGAASLLLARVERDGAGATDVGGWPAPIGITLVADLFSALMLVIGLITILAVLLFAIGHPATDDDTPVFHPVYLVLTAGVALAFVTGDLFNLFVAFEIMLVSSYVLITLGGRQEQIRTGMTYVVINLLASSLFVAAIGFAYAATGTVNLAELANRMAQVPDGVRTTLSLLTLLVFGIKAAIFPLFFWLPDSYPTARTSVTAIFAGLLTKVGVYAIVRTQMLLFPGQTPTWVLLAIAAATMIVGVLGAIAQNDMKRILSFHIISQIGYMLFGFALFTVAGAAATVLFMLHQIPVKTSLFLVGGLIEQRTGTTALDRVGGMVHKAPLIAALFGLAALSLAGLPPFSGFVGKLALVEAGFDASAWAIVAVSLVVSVLTLFSMVKIWSGVFWGVPDDPEATDGGPVPRLLYVSSAGLVAVTLLIALCAGPLWDLSVRAGAQLLDPDGYVAVVMER
ncbi:proton-conducting transporter transmembrane domain-containing protein [Rhabdothermincola sediminis]|uniref:proton-conducting transporter transmembrane domain-containing protein n=1 Tax=Rhabdothermincola sediminis TaxID=2751370 RepID=UPI001AA0AB98|nr:proton-conducting transporter membrane subunit [Rhabdothermincola sediminis]